MRRTALISGENEAREVQELTCLRGSRSDRERVGIGIVARDQVIHQIIHAFSQLF